MIKAEVSASLHQSSVSHDPSEIILICWFIINVGNSCVASVRVLSLRSSVIHGFVTEPWHSRHVLFSCERLVLCWSMVFGSRHSCLEFRFRVGVWTLALHVSLCERAVSSSLCRELSCPRVLVLHGRQFVFLSAACIHVMSCAVWHAARVLHWLPAFMLSCLVWTRGFWVFSLAVCSCPVLHMAVDLFCWPCACGFVLCEHMAFVLVFCVPCALMSIVLTPPILLPDYWLICPTCVFLVTVLICSLYNFLVFAVLCQFVIACILPCQACQLSCFFPHGVVFVACFVLFLINKAHSPAPLSPRLIPLPNPDSFIFFGGPVIFFLGFFD